MKHIVYADTQKLNSFYAQAFDGLEDVRTKGEGYERLNKTRLEPAINKRKFKGGLTSHFTTCFSREQTYGRKIKEYSDAEMTDERVSVRMHDNSLSHIMMHADSKKLVCDSKAPIAGMYTTVTGVFELIHIDYLIQHTLSDTMISNVANSFTSVWENNSNKKDFPKGLSSLAADEVRKQISQQYEQKRDALTLLQTSLPFDVFVSIGEFIIPLRKEFFLENADSIPFLYEGELTVFGRVTRVCSHFVNSDRNADQIARKTNEMLVSVFQNIKAKADSLVYIYPIAAFFELKI